MTTSDRDTASTPQHFDTIVVGSGQAGLSVGYHLDRRGVDFLIVDGAERVGDSWRNRWDSLRLFTNARYDGLDGMAFPAPPSCYPSKDEMADYLESYAEHFGLPVRLGFRVDRLSEHGDRYMIASGDEVIEADNVVVAMAEHQVSRTPAFATDLDPAVCQIHSSQYRRPSQLPPGDVLVVGAGNSGAEIALDLARFGGRHVWLSGRHPGHVPFDIEGAFGRHVAARIVTGFVFHRLLKVTNPVGRRFRDKMRGHGGPLVRTRPQDLVAAGVEQVGRTVAVASGLPQLDDGRILDVAAVVWATGFTQGFSWIDDDLVTGDDPNDELGVVAAHPGLFFVGRAFTYALSSGQVHGVGRDAARIADAIAARQPLAESRSAASAA
jgi:putative flavoprotein involved in K+ transport